ncbi:MAG: AAA family ATPase [Chloroflexi bacterium]|nr:MAG: ATPase [Phototrophicales bacterium]RMF82398.1 MAG: AAA family ATPase [Chloroflexota bacterium]
MSLAKREPSPNLSNEPPRQRFAWEDEATLVDERRKLSNRIKRLPFKRLILLALIFWALADADVMRAVLAGLGWALPFVGRFLFIGAFIIGQFGLMFWFLGRARMYTIWPGSEAEGVSFADYRGQPELLEQARQIVTLLRGVKAFEDAGGEPLHGLLLEGPPGTGKTWLAQAISTEAGVPFFYIDASGMTSMFFGIAPLKVMNLYRKARSAANDYGASIIFIDEVDAVGSRGGVAQKRETYREDEIIDDATVGSWFSRLPIMFGGMGGANLGLLSTLLVEMSGFSQEHGWMARKKRWFYNTFLRRDPPPPNNRVLTIGATNRIEALDQALLRPGRFDKKIRVDAPDLEGRRDIFEYYLSKMAHDDSMDPLILAVETQFYTPADIKYLLNEALRYALFDGRTYMTYRDFKLAQPEHEMGLRTPIKNLTYEAKYRLAAHEAGHAMAVRMFMPDHRISRITIIQQGFALGHVSHMPATENYQYIRTYEELHNHLRVAVAGKAGEMEFAGEDQQTLGVAGDFASIRAVLGQMGRAGMFGPMGMFDEPEASKEIRQMMEETFLQALEEVRLAFRAHHEMGEALITLLMEKDELLSDEVEAFFDQYGFFTPKVHLLEEQDKAGAVIRDDVPELE